jgi:predicted 2-oxoglutarate/Fe(II)-dependent dioxygenase YbiX
MIVVDRLLPRCRLWHAAAIRGRKMTITRELAEILGDVDRPGDFFASGRAEFLAPRIEVEGVGPIALPLLPAQAKKLIKAATRAPYGRGADTVVDTKVRRTWQIEASRVSISGKHWAKTLDGIVARAAEGLGVAEPVTAEVYKLLVYDNGSFFVSHRDTEKAPGMFATLVLALPSQSKGGELVVRHKDREARLDLACEEPSEIAFAAFYADCVHEVLPVTAGCRATLVFNLVRTAKGKAPEPPNYDAEADKVTQVLRGWVDEKCSEGAADSEGADDATDAANASPEKLIIPLEHAYTPAELAFDRLKGADAAVARLLATAAPKAGCDLNLALLTVWESGSAEYSGRENWHYRRGRRDSGVEEDASEFEVVEVHDWSKTLSDWRRPDGAATTLGKLPIKDDEVSPPDALDDMEPDEEHFHEATGNEGASFERTYARAALVIWPANRILAVLNQGGLEATLPFLGDLTARWQAAGPKKGLSHKQQATELAGHMIATWPQRTWYERERSEASDLGRMLGLLARLGDLVLVEHMIDALLSQQGHDKADNTALLEAIALFSPDRAAELLQKIVATNAVNALGSCGALLAGALKGAFAKTPAPLHGAAKMLLDRLPGYPASAPQDQWGRPRGGKPDAAFTVDLVDVVDRIDVGLAKQAAAHILAWPRHFDLDRVLVPAARRLIQSKHRSGPACDAVHAAAIAHLEARIAELLEAPRDWTRPSAIGCRCAHCAELSGFLADGAHESWTLRAAQQVRTHVEDEIRRASADVDTETLRRGSPHSLICRKNQASYERRIAQRKQDLADLAALRR